MGVRIDPFRPADQPAVRALIEAGLADRFGGPAAPGLNPDLADLATSYATGTTLVAWLADRVIGTGTVVPREPGVEEIVRMSVAGDLRGRGIGRRLLTALRDAALGRGATRLVCETCDHWHDAVRLYLSFGFVITHHRDSGHCRDAHFSLDLGGPAQRSVVR